MKGTFADIRRVVTGIVQPMRRGIFVSKLKLNARLKDIIPFGEHDKFVDAAQFGFISYPAKGVFGYFLNFGGDRLSPIIISHQDNKRPTDTMQGGSTQYSTTETGDEVKSRFDLHPDGKSTLGSTAADEPFILGLVAKLFFQDILTILSSQADKLKVLSEKLDDQATKLSAQATELATQATSISTHVHAGVLPGGSSTAPPTTAAAFVTNAVNFTTKSGEFTVLATTFSTKGTEFGTIKTDIDNQKASPIDDDKIISDKNFTEKGV